MSLASILRGLASAATGPTGRQLAAGAALYGIGALAKNSVRPFQDDLGTGKLVFPLDLERFAISMCFQFFEYKRPSIFTQAYQKASGTIRLPVAKSIVDKFQISWEESQNDPLIGAVIEAMSGGMSTTNAAITGGAALALKSAIENSSAGLSLTANKVLQPLGMAMNPFLTVLFKQPNFKRHSFTWKLIPKSPEEARQINAIIQTFKYHMLPSLVEASAGTALAYPEMVRISFHNFDDYLYRFKPCVVESISVNYAAGSQGPSFFKGELNVPTEIDLQINFLEIEYWLKEDFNPSSIGGYGGYVPSTSIKP